jgi:transcription initiation factor TFIIIB Brf1 subunit/transcription initiation factor TFIIB
MADCPECEEKLHVWDPMEGYTHCTECGWDERAEEPRPIDIKYYLETEEHHATNATPPDRDRPLEGAPGR